MFVAVWFSSNSHGKTYGKIIDADSIDRTGVTREEIEKIKASYGDDYIIENDLKFVRFHISPKFETVTDILKTKCTVSPLPDDAFMPDFTLSKYTSIGCYPLFYFSGDEGILCPECATGFLYDEVEHFQPVNFGINEQDPSLFCDNCSGRIESAYAEDEVW